MNNVRKDKREKAFPTVSSKGGTFRFFGGSGIVNRGFMLISSLLLLFSSCTMEELDSPKKPPGSGKMVAVHFALGGLNHNGNEVVMRSAATHSEDASSSSLLQERGEEAPFGGVENDAETVVVPIGEGLAMVATLGIDTSVKTRTTTSNIAPGTKLRIVAYEKNGYIHPPEDFTVGSNETLVPVSGDPFEVPEGEYKFVVYAYNNPAATLPGHSETIQDINPDYDLIWGCYPTDGTTVTVDEHTFNNITITMEHKFSGVKVILSTDSIGSVPITDIFNLSIGGKQADLIVKDGTFSPNTGAVKRSYTGSFTGLGTSQVSTSASNPVMVHTGNAPMTTLHIDSLFLNTSTGIKRFFKLSAGFEKQLQGGVIYTLKVHFKKDEGITGDFRPQNLTNLIMYVGAFWKSNQTGERLITIKRPTHPGTNYIYNDKGQLISNPAPINYADGAWTAKVIVGSDWIVLDTLKSKDPGVGTNSPTKSGNDPGFDTDYPVNSTLRTVSGVMNQNTPQIYFRIGLTSTYEGPSDYPTRYGVILLTYRNNELRHRIWIRQGHEADYLICNGAPVCTDPTHTQGLKVPRTVTRKFSPYNLTADTLDRQVMSQADANIVPKLPGNRSRFTDYPTQTGAFFKWANVQTPLLRIAFNPYSQFLPNPPSTTSWYGVYDENSLDSTPTGFWNTHSANNETCPPGYRRPNDGYSDKAESSQNIEYSELRQSLFEHPLKGLGYNEDMSNSSFGYYADGFFDRRQIVAGSIKYPNRLTTVAKDTRDIAHAGRIFYNAFTDYHHANASIFFPYGGLRIYYNPGDLFYTPGIITEYWTSSRTSTTGWVHILSFTDDGAAMHIQPWHARGDSGFLIRCVKDE